MCTARIDSTGDGETYTLTWNNEVYKGLTWSDITKKIGELEGLQDDSEADG